MLKSYLLLSIGCMQYCWAGRVNCETKCGTTVTTFGAVSRRLGCPQYPNSPLHMSRVATVFLESGLSGSVYFEPQPEHAPFVNSRVVVLEKNVGCTITTTTATATAIAAWILTCTHVPRSCGVGIRICAFGWTCCRTV